MIFTKYDANLALIRAIDVLSEHANKPMSAETLDLLEAYIRRMQEAYAQLRTLCDEAASVQPASNVVYLD
ncbi:hypothetical protein [Chthonobacter albigriseus]|uniref:hypothetical protein n=1 Tax=Chthonobacter albigriseus TaxID=1683161 RepID=UPI0015EF4F26|nr:hypothetical protein [Chthonobacter albigriseus]